MRFDNHADQFQNDYTKEQNQQFSQVFGELTEEFRAAMAEGIPASHEKVQALVARHYEFVTQFWTPTREAYKSLAMSYILPSPYRDTYEGVQAGLGKYHYDAIVVWADANLE